MDKDLLEILKIVADELTVLVKIAISENSGKDGNTKISENGSFLKNTYFEVTRDGNFRLKMPRKVIKSKQTKIPVQNIISWMKRKGITPRKGKTINQAAYAISMSLYKRGLESGIFSDWINDAGLAEYAAEQLTGYLSKKILDDLVAAFKV
jgi:hypothetical protein